VMFFFILIDLIEIVEMITKEYQTDVNKSD